MFSLQDDFLNVPVDKAANNVPFVRKHFYAVTIIKGLNLDCHLSNQDHKNTYTFISDKTKDQIIEKHSFNFLNVKPIELTKCWT